MISKQQLYQIERNKERYWIHGWSEGYFDINDRGNVIIRTCGEGVPVELNALMKVLVSGGIEPPILFRFDGILKDRIDRLHFAFESAIGEFQYQNIYQLAYPIKVNQQRHVVDVIRTSGKEYKLGLEVGSKPELLAMLSVHDAEGALLLCNGYKDAEYVELGLLARKIGRRSIITIEQSYELDLVLDIAEKHGLEAEIGLRMNPSGKGSGRWAGSSGELAKFGLHIHEIIHCIEKLKKKKKEHWLKLLHFHIGSQVTSIVPIKKALREATRMYTEIAKLCPSISFFNVGGGLGIDYDGSKTSHDSSVDYSMEEYARDVVYAIQEACDAQGLFHPVIVSESGRALVAHHSLLVTEVMDVSSLLESKSEIEPPPSRHPILVEFYELYQIVEPKNCHEIFHDVIHLQENTIQEFTRGKMELVERAYADRIYWHLIYKIRRLSKKLNYVPRDIERLDEKLLDIYFCNFSVFQSLPDAWAIDQIFPVMPIHRLNEKPSRRAQVVDLSCDSDGKIEKYVGSKKIQDHLPLHEFDPSVPYYLGIFLVGAYQEILGGFHNLFGDTNTVHVDLDDNGRWKIKHQIEGDTMSQVLGYVQYSTPDLIERLRRSIEKALREGRLTNEESALLTHHYKQALDSYTYLVVEQSNNGSSLTLSESLNMLR